MRTFVADLHVHTCLSPCGDTDMSPRKIVETACLRGIEIVAICDHNSCENVAAVIRAARRKGLKILPGMEITSVEEVHIVALFENLDEALALQLVIYEHLSGENDRRVFGPQVVVNEFDEILRFNQKLLIGATDLAIGDVVDHIHRLGGLAIAAHIDREGFGIIGQLGFIPGNIPLDALEVSSRLNSEQAAREFASYADYPFVTASDAHRPEQIGCGTTRFLLEKPSLGEIKKALREEGGRRIAQ
jgi:PHP family Zn ribbon phosphoesterase